MEDVPGLRYPCGSEILSMAMPHPHPHPLGQYRTRSQEDLDRIDNPAGPDIPLFNVQPHSSAISSARMSFIVLISNSVHQLFLVSSYYLIVVSTRDKLLPPSIGEIPPQSIHHPLASTSAGWHQLLIHTYTATSLPIVTI